MADTLQDRYRREACQQLVAGEGWRCLLEHIVGRLAQLDAFVYQVDGTGAVFPHAVGGHNELVALVRFVSQTAGVPNPFDVHRQALWSAVMPRVPVSQEPSPGASGAPTAEEKAAAVATMRAQRKRGGGAVA